MYVSNFARRPIMSKSTIWIDKSVRLDHEWNRTGRTYAQRVCLSAKVLSVEFGPQRCRLQEGPDLTILDAHRRIVGGRHRIFAVNQEIAAQCAGMLGFIQVVPLA